MATTFVDLPRIQRPTLLLAAVIAAALFATLWGQSQTRAWVLLIGLGLGVSLYHAAFGFTAAYRRAIEDKDLSGIAAQVVMLIVAMVLFAPMLTAGEVFGHRAGGAVAPVSVAMLTGAFVFGIGMQLGGACASGTLFTVGGGNSRMMVTLVFFCLGSWWGTLDLAWWRALPGLPPIALGKEIGYGPAVALQAGLLILVLAGLYRLGARMHKPLGWGGSFAWHKLLQGPWPLLWGALGLALLNAAMLMVTGQPWGVTWGFTLWGAKAMAALGWEPSTSAYWSQGWTSGALDRSILSSSVSVSNIGILIGALAAGSLAGKIGPTLRIGWRPLAAAVIGGLMMGYGARLAYGCNIGAFFSGVASTSLHGWAWIVMALLGSVIGIRLRPWFRLGT
ncbi:MAG: YeeE/YedE family protein [Alphaproteobacteria bacterium]|nr:YeeE/YedE family protein [Alphaproteobacteria bacterium]